MDNETTNSPEQVIEKPAEPEAQLVDNPIPPVAETPQVDTQENRVVEEKAETTDIGADFVKGIITEALDEKSATPEFVTECVARLKDIGITDREIAGRAINYVCKAREDFITANADETLKHFGASMQNFTAEYVKAMSEAQTALKLLDSKVNGIANVLNTAGIQGDLRIVLALQKLYPLLCEDGNLMNGGTGGSAQQISDADIMFGEIKSL